MTTSLFVYGTLELPDVMRAVTGRIYAGEPCVLEGYRRALLKGRDYPGIARAPGEHTEGTLIRGVDAASLQALDRYEGEEYERRKVEVRLHDRQRVAAEAFVLAPAHADLLGHEPWNPGAYAAGRRD